MTIWTGILNLRERVATETNANVAVAFPRGSADLAKQAIAGRHSPQTSGGLTFCHCGQRPAARVDVDGLGDMNPLETGATGSPWLGRFFSILAEPKPPARV
jgi:hypothetical protein